MADEQKLVEEARELIEHLSGGKIAQAIDDNENAHHLVHHTLPGLVDALEASLERERKLREALEGRKS